MEEAEESKERREEYARVVDFMLSGKSYSNRAEPLAQLLGEEWFTLLEAQPREQIALNLGERVYIGKDERDKIYLIKGRIGYEDLTQTAKNELPNVVMQIIMDNEHRFVDVFNKSGPLNIREHSLELLPGVGKKHLKSILEARDAKPFENFADIKSRVPLLQDPAKLIRDRVINELMGSERFYMFTKPYRKRFQ
jgi:putative nucleotide binding protein